MAQSRGKEFEAIVKDCFEQVRDTYILRLYDPQGGYLSVANPCDFVVYRHKQMYMIECKSVHGNTFPIYGNDPKKKYGNISNTQWQGLLDATRYGVVSGVMIWWIDTDTTKFIPIQLIKQLRDSGAKSIRYDTDLGILIEGKKKRVFFDYDFEKFFSNFEKCA